MEKKEQDRKGRRVGRERLKRKRKTDPQMDRINSF